MLKGINRRIIEINRTNNDYFEKAILFVKSDKSGCPPQILSSQADLFLNELPKGEKKPVTKVRVYASVAVFLIIAIVIVAML